MIFRTISLLVALTISVANPSLATNGTLPMSGNVYVTPHAQFSSSIGVLGCKVNVNRIAYWPYFPDCTNMCIKLTFGSRSRTVLHIDQSGRNYDISFDTFQYLLYDSSATASPAILNPSSGTNMDYEIVDMSECSDIITSDTGKLSIIAANPNQVISCVSQPDSWIKQNYELRNIRTSDCMYGVDEVCTFDAVTGTASCPSMVGTDVDLSPAQPVIDYIAPCGATQTAGAAAVVANVCSMVTQTPNPSS